MAGRMQYLGVKTDLITEECCNCGVLFAFPEHLYEQFRKTKESFYCPNGHGQSYTGKTDAQKLKEMEQRLAVERDNANFWREQEEKARRQKSAIKGQLTKTKKRIANGVCPCCNRHFDNLQDHMQGEHPEYVTEEKTDG